jgi:transposase-like protein
MAQRRNFGKDFKAKVAVEAIRGQKTINEIASIYGIHPSMVNKWKKLALERLPELMEDRHSNKQQDRNFDEARLHQKIGQMAVEIDFLKKKLMQLGLQNE